MYHVPLGWFNKMSKAVEPKKIFEDLQVVEKNIVEPMVHAEPLKAVQLPTKVGVVTLCGTFPKSKQVLLLISRKKRKSLCA